MESEDRSPGQRAKSRKLQEKLTSVPIHMSPGVAENILESEREPHGVPPLNGTQRGVLMALDDLENKHEHMELMHNLEKLEAYPTAKLEAAHVEATFDLIPEEDEQSEGAAASSPPAAGDAGQQPGGRNTHWV